MIGQEDFDRIQRYAVDTLNEHPDDQPASDLVSLLTTIEELEYTLSLIRGILAECYRLLPGFEDSRLPGDDEAV